MVDGALRASPCVPSELVARLEVAEAGSVELDCDIGIVLGDWSPPRRAVRDPDRPDIWRRDGIKHYQPYAEVTRSLDAALALAERVLPGLGAWDVGYAYNAAPLHYARLVIVREGPPEEFGRAATPALALCIAILKASQSAECAQSNPDNSKEMG